MKQELICGNKSTINGSKAYILGVLCGDGSLYKYEERGYQRFCCGLTALDKEFLEYFITQIEISFGIKYKLSQYDRNTKDLAGNPVIKHYYSVVCKKKEIYDELLSYSNTFKTRGWNVPTKIIEQNKKVKGMFLRGLFDSDGCIVFEWKNKKKTYRYPSIRLDSTNKNGLMQVKNLLEDLGIGCYTHSSWKNLRNRIFVHRIIIKGIKRAKLFSEIIGFGINKKQEKLNHSIQNAGLQ